MPEALAERLELRASRGLTDGRTGPDRLPTPHAVLTSGSFAVNLPHGEAERVAAPFASGVPDRFERVAWWPG